jgi:hypothetical protein
MSACPAARAARIAATLLSASLVLAASLTPAAASAATKAATPAASAPAAATAALPLATGEFEMQLWPSTTSALMLVSLRLPETTQLPARVRMPLPEGATVTWSGEILGTNAAADVKRPYTIITGNGGRAIEFVAQTSRDLQYEADLPAPTVAGSRVMTTLTWVQTADALGVDPAVKTPAGATSVQIKPAPATQPRTNTAGEALYTLPQQHPALGSAFSVEVTFVQGAAAPIPVSAAPASTSGNGWVVWGLLALLLAVIAVIVVVALRAGLKSDSSKDD